MNIVFLGLTLLNSLTGNCFISNVPTTTAILKEAVIGSESHVIASDYNFMDTISYYDDVYNMNGVNRYVEIQTEDQGWILFDKIDSVVVEREETTPFDYNRDTLKIYDEDCLGFRYCYYDNNLNDFVMYNNNIGFTKSVINFYTTNNILPGEYSSDIPISSSANKISNYQYFYNLNDFHGENQSTCVIIAAEMLLGYYDTFLSDLIVDETFDVNTTEQINKVNFNWRDFNQSPGVDSMSLGINHFHDYFVDICKTELNIDPIGRGLYYSDLISLLDIYLEKFPSYNYNLITSEGNVADLLTQRIVALIKNAIDNDRPILVGGQGHATVAFAYDENYVWVHTGWGFVGATPWSTFTNISQFEIFCVDLDFNLSHVHSDNYYNEALDQYLCPCGAKYTTTTISPSDFNFPQEYNHDVIYQGVELEKINLYTYRKRTGYIENEFINVSPIHDGEGEAFIQIFFSKYIRSFTINLSYWQILDKLSPEESSSFLQIYQFSRWDNKTDLIAANLSTDRNNQNTFSYDFFEYEIEGIGIESFGPAAGERNLGRISIGEIKIIHRV